MKSSHAIFRAMMAGYLVLFFTYMFLPLILMSIIAFNANDVPQITPWKGFTFCMLLVMARAQRFDLTQEEAAFDLGATHSQVFLKITLPFLRPALLSAAALAFMQSFDNYNTTLFAIGIEQTLPIYIGTKLRSFISPAMNALAVVFVVLTILGAVIYEYRRRREMANRG